MAFYWKFSILWFLVTLAWRESLQNTNAGNTAEDFKVHEQEAGLVIGAVFGSIIGLAIIIGVFVCICVFVSRKKKQRIREQRTAQRREMRHTGGASGPAPPPYSLQAPPAYSATPMEEPPPFFSGYRNPQAMLNGGYNRDDGMPEVG